MCSNRSLCGDNNRSSRSRSESSGSGAHYALCALGVGLIALGIVMIVWTVIPSDGPDQDGPDSAGGSSTHSNNSTSGPDGDGDEDEDNIKSSSSVALVLVGVGGAMLLLSLCLGIRSKKHARERAAQPAVSGGPLMAHAPGEAAATVPDAAAFNVPSYEEVVGSDEYPVRHSNLRHSTSQLPSYEDIIAAVENEGAEPTNNPDEDTPLNASAPGAAANAAAEQPEAEEADASRLSPKPSLPARSSSRASRLLRPLRVRRIKSDKLHLKDFRLQIRTPTQNPVTIEPITPPPQYENKMPELQ